MTTWAMPAAPARLLADAHASGQPADLDRHLRRYGPLPLHAPARRGRAGALVAVVEESGLTGRGGAGFPTGRKMRTVAERRGPAVVVANGMEGEPASGKDQALLRLAPHLVLDGAVLAAEAVGATAVHLCLPRNRPALLHSLSAVVAQRRTAGIDRVPVQVHALPHHYASSEETALVHWLRGGEAKPLHTPPRPFEHGVGGRPTLIDNVETLAHVALVARYGAPWFRQAGRPDAPGTTLVTVSGAVAAPGVYEAELGTPLRDVLAAAGGPVEPLRAVLTGGYGGAWLDADTALASALARSDLAAVGGALGAGVLVALPARACGLAQTARVLAYLADGGAAQCGPCRFGLPAIAADVAELAAGWFPAILLDRLERRLAVVAGRGACRHPDGAVRLAASALTVFASDVQAHRNGPCAGVPEPPVLAVPSLDLAGGGWR